MEREARNRGNRSPQRKGWIPVFLLLAVTLLWGCQTQKPLTEKQRRLARLAAIDMVNYKKGKSVIQPEPKGHLSNMSGQWGMQQEE